MRDSMFQSVMINLICWLSISFYFVGNRYLSIHGSSLDCWIFFANFVGYSLLTLRLFVREHKRLNRALERLKSSDLPSRLYQDEPKDEKEKAEFARGYADAEKEPKVAANFLENCGFEEFIERQWYAKGIIRFLLKNDSCLIRQELESIRKAKKAEAN